MICAANNVEPLVSVVIPTLNGGRRFQAALAALRTQTGAGEPEIVVVDSGSSDGTADWARGSGARVLTVPEFNHGAARNTGASASRGRYVVFLSQDAVPVGRHFLSELLAVFHGRQQKLAGVSARQLPFPGDRAHARLRTLGDDHHFPVTRWTPLDDVACAIPRELLLAKPLPEVTFGEDFLWMKAQAARGYLFGFAPRALVWHSHDRPPGYWFWRCFVDAALHAENGGPGEPGSSGAGAGFLAQLAGDSLRLWREPAGGLKRLIELGGLPVYTFADQLGAYCGKHPRWRRLLDGHKPRL